jgi:LuxR family maltose regulon positive regulatory protein
MENSRFGSDPVIFVSDQTVGTKITGSTLTIAQEVKNSCVYNDEVSNLLPTKFYFPPVPTGFVARPQLLETLDEVLDHRLALVSASAGAGKTILVSSWVRSARKKGTTFGWLSLDTADNDPAVFLEYLGTCLEEGGTVIDIPVLPSGEVEKNLLERTLAEFIRGLMELKQEVILILDDYHVIESKQVHAAVQYILNHAPMNLHLILLTRSDPPLELARLRVGGQLVEVRMEQLRFSTAEAGEFLEKTAGMQLTESQVTAVNERAEGWIAGLQMAAISLRGRTDVAEFVVAFAGSHRFVIEYLLEQVLDRQSPEVREFLLKTSILDRLSAPLCDAVAGIDGGAQRMLETIDHANLFLVPLDDEHAWFRYHHLFSDLLRLILNKNHPGLSVELHHLACHWYESQGLLPEALHHGLAAGDMELVAHIVSGNVLALVDMAEITPTLAQIDAIRDSQPKPLPWLDVAYAWGLAYAGQNQKAGMILSSAEQHLEKMGKEKREIALGHISAVRAYLAWTDGSKSDEAVALAKKADTLLPEDEIAIRSVNLTTLGNALIQISDGFHSAEVLERALLLAQQAGQDHGVMQAASGLAYVYLLLGNLKRVHAICEEAFEIAKLHQQRYSRPLTAVASVYAMFARYWLEVGEFEKALLIARKGVALAEIWGQVDTLMMCMQNLIYALSFTNQTDEVKKNIQKIRKIAQKGPPWHLMTVDYVEMEIFLDSDPQNRDEIQEEADRKRKTIDSPIESMDYLNARILVKQKRPIEALAFMEYNQKKSEQYSNYIKIRIFIFKALAYFLLNKQAACLNELKQAIILTENDDRVTVFVREGAEMEKLLRMPQSRSISPVFVSRLLAAFESQRGQKSTPVSSVDKLIEPLSTRELEVLQHLNGYLSIPEIADLLVVSTNTIRTHIKSIYGKLGVHGRSGAVRRANDLGLLV